MQNSFSISIVLPMYNEQDNIGQTLSYIVGVFSKINIDYQIIVCNDGSSDNSGQVVTEFSNNNNRIQLINHPKHIGYGYMLRSGFQIASKDLVMYTDSDLPCDISILEDKLNLFTKTDILVGFRINSRENLLRKFYSIVYNFIIKAVFGIKVKDINFSFKIFKKEVINNLFLKSNGPFIDGEIMAKAIRSGYRVEEIEVEYLPRKYGKSKLSSLGCILYILYEMVKLYPEIKRIKKHI